MRLSQLYPGTIYDVEMIAKYGDNGESKKSRYTFETSKIFQFLIFVQCYFVILFTAMYETQVL